MNQTDFRRSMAGPGGTEDLVIRTTFLYGLAFGAAAAWYAQQIWGLSQALGLTVGGFLAIAVVVLGAQIAWVRLGHKS